jgi:UDP-N-acetylmuramyl tripeptide synthase
MNTQKLGSNGSTMQTTKFNDWRARLDREQIAPVVAFAGSRGKTSVLRAVEAILRAGGYRFASWTDQGVEIAGERQRGELGPWSRVLTRLRAGGLDIALQELDWVTLQAVAAHGTSYPVVVVSMLCGNNEACLVTPETFLARRALTKIRSRLAPAGRLVLNADDFSVIGPKETDAPSQFLAGISVENPGLARHLKRGGDGCWVEHGSIMVREDGQSTRLTDLSDLHWTHSGAVPFAVHNALLATAVARSCGIPHSVIAEGLAAHDARPELMPGSFNVFAFGSALVVIDRPMPSWFLRMSLRAALGLSSGRLVRVVGPMREVGKDDLVEVGRLLGRNGGALIVHGDWTAERLTAFRQGAAANEVPPIYLRAESERSAMLQGLAMLRTHDVMLVLAEDALAAVRLMARHANRTPAKQDTVGAA